MAFNGIPKSGLKFLRDLKKNNNREWFTEKKPVYQESLIEPLQEFIVALGSRLEKVHPNVHYDTKTNGTGSLFRIYRDVRFSKDKSPYKTHAGMVFWVGERGKKMDNPGYYVEVTGSHAQVFAGFWVFTKPAIKLYREAVDDDGKELAAILKRLERAKYDTGEEHYKKVPRGYPADHPHATLLKYSGVHARGPKIPTSVVSSKSFVSECVKHCRKMSPLVHWLDKAV